MPDLLQPQPPPGVPAPGPCEEAPRPDWKMDLMVRAGLWSVILLLVFGIGLCSGWRPSFLPKKRTGCGPNETTSNARQIGLALYEFNNEYGRYPDRATAAEVKGKTGSTLALGDRTSNDLFAQLIAGKFTQSEKMFYARAKAAIKPDDVFNTDASLLKHGECAYAYIMGVDPKGDPQTPIAFGPVIPGTRTLDGKANEGKVAILRNDNSATSLPIDSSGKVFLTVHGLDFLDPRQPCWKGKAPDVKWPK